MSYAIFTARKLLLTRRINQLNARLMQLSQQQQTLSDAAGKREIARSNQKMIFSTLGNIFQSGLTMQQNTLMNSLRQKVASGDMSSEEYQQQYNSLFQAGVTGSYSLANTPMGQLLTIQSQIIDYQAQTDMRQVKEIENQIELQKKSIETQLKAADAELKEVEKAEDNNIKNSAPKFA